MTKSTKSDSDYNRKRNFDITSEPREEHSAREKKPAREKRTSALRFVVQKHAARRLHYDFRLELDGTLKSWAVPKGPSLDPQDKRLAVHVEDHPLAYASFEGSIPPGQYGAGDVIVWDQGVWRSLDDDPTAAYDAGKLKFTLIGEKLSGYWNLVRTTMRASGDKEQWLLIKERDHAARRAADYNIVKEEPDSVLSSAHIPEKPAGKSAAKTTAGAHKSATRSASKNTPAHNVRSIKAGQTLPEHLAPELATLVSEPLTGKWLYEVKFDGYRILTRILDGEVRLFTRNDNDWTRRMPKQVQAIEALGLDKTWLDGEVVILNDEGLPDFQALQQAFDIGRSHNIVYYVFDAPFLNGSDMRRLPVEERRAALESVMPANNKGLVRFSTAFEDGHTSILETACALSLEGIIGKRLGSPYVSRRSADWIKLKCRLRQEFVIVGYTPPQGSRSSFGALLLGVYKKAGGAELLYAGRVGTGFNAASLKDIHRRLRPLERADSPLSHSISASEARDVHWLEPTLVGEVEFAEWTGDNRLRQASFIALRSDKPAAEIIREQPRTAGDGGGTSRNSATKKSQTAPAKAKATPHKDTEKKDSSALAGVKITHPEREIDSESHTRKIDLARFYEDISEWILPQLDDRPVSLLRLPTGLDGEQFFQKHSEHLAIPAVKQLDPDLDPGHARLMEIDSAAALVGAVQMGTIEFHTWGSTSDRIEKPDRIILDLDPDPALPWKSMLDATRLTLAVLDELGLETFLKTSGGKGIHLIIPLARRDDWITIKEFAKAIAQFMARQLPDRFVARMGPKNRVGKIFVDYLRNQRGASTVAAYSVRARTGLPVSVPITRDELTHLHGAAQWHIGNLRRRLAALKSDPWADYANQQRITKAMWKRLGVPHPD